MRRLAREPGRRRRRDAGGGPAGDRPGPAGGYRAHRASGAATAAEAPAAATSPLTPAALDIAAVEERAVALASAADATVPLEVVVAVDAPPAWLLDLAQRTGLVVMRGHGRLGPPMLSAGDAAGQAPDVTFDCPVLVVDGQDLTGPEAVLAHEPAVVAGLDMVRASEPVLLTAAAEAVSRGVGLTLVHALDRDTTLEPAALADGWRRCRAALRCGAPAARGAQPSGRQPGGPGRSP